MLNILKTFLLITAVLTFVLKVVVVMTEVFLFFIALFYKLTIKIF